MGTRKNIVQILDSGSESGSESMRHTHYVTLYLINVCCVCMVDHPPELVTVEVLLCGKD